MLRLQMANMKSDQEQAAALLTINKQKALQVAAYLHIPAHEMPSACALGPQQSSLELVIWHQAAHDPDPGHAPSCHP